MRGNLVVVVCIYYLNIIRPKMSVWGYFSLTVMYVTVFCFWRLLRV